jgi:hypothetical protein
MALILNLSPILLKKATSSLNNQFLWRKTLQCVKTGYLEKIY